MAESVRRRGPRIKSVNGNYRGVISAKNAPQTVKEYRAGIAEGFIEQQDPNVQLAIEAYLAGGDTGMLTYDPTKGTTPMPKGHRTESAAYDRVNQLLFITFRGGVDTYVYENVTQAEWSRFRRAASPGRYIDRVLNLHNYYKIG